MECGRGPGIYARRSRAYARVFVYLCGTPENPVDERDRRPRERGEEEEQEEAEEDARVRGVREGPYPMKGKNEDGGKSQWPTKVCCPFVTRERVGRYTPREHPTMQQEHQETNDSHPTIITTTPPIARFSPSGPSFSFSHTALVTSTSPLLSSLFLSLSRFALFLEIPARSTASLRLLPFGSLGATTRSKHALRSWNFCVSSRRLCISGINPPVRSLYFLSA